VEERAFRQVVAIRRAGARRPDLHHLNVFDI